MPLPYILCSRHMSDSDYVGKRFQDHWITRHDPRPLKRAHFKRLYDEAAARLDKAVSECGECTRNVEETA